MNEATTHDFFERLERELRAAAERRPRRMAGGGRAAATAVLALAALALAVVPVVAVLTGGPGSDGRVSPAGQPRVGSVVERHGQRYRVVAVGDAPAAGPWQLVTYRSSRLADPESGEVYQPAGLRCLGIYVPGKIESGQCGEFPRTPGFSRVQDTFRARDGKARELLVYGRVPERAAAVVVRLKSGPELRVLPLEGPPGAQGDFYLVALPPDASGGLVNWVDRAGRAGSRGIRLLPP